MELRVDRQNHVVLLVETDERFAKVVSQEKGTVDVRKLPANELDRKYPLRYEGYPLEDYASRMLNKPSLGVVVTSRAKAIMLGIINKEPEMGKIATPTATKPAATKPAETKPEKPVKGKVAPVAETKTEAAEGTSARVRRDKIEGDKRIKVLKENPARQGTVRHAIVDTIFKAKNVQEAVSSTVTRKDGEGEYKIGMPDIYFALDNGLIELY